MNGKNYSWKECSGKILEHKGELGTDVYEQVIKPRCLNCNYAGEKDGCSYIAGVLDGLFVLETIAYQRNKEIITLLKRDLI